MAQPFPPRTSSRPLPPVPSNSNVPIPIPVSRFNPNPPSASTATAKPSPHTTTSSSARPSPQTSTETADSESTSSLANVKRSRSIQFLPIQSPLGKASSPRAVATDAQAEGEQAVGETTPIISSERGGGRGYRAFETLGPPATEGVGGRNGSGGGMRRRGRTGSDSRRGAVSSGEGDTEDGIGWWGRFMEKYGSVELDNKGSVARDHLALERTFLAWLRTSLAFASIGIAVTQLFRLNTTISEGSGLTPTPVQPGTIRLRQVGKPLGATFLGISILVLIVGGRRYFESQYWIIRGKFPASRGSVCLITFVAIALIVTSLVVVCTVNPTQFQGNE